MKRFLCVLLVLATIGIPGAIAESIDIDSMALMDLLELRSKVDAKIDELLKTSVSVSEIYQGEYLVGKDIAPGRYLFTCNKDIDAQYEEDFAYWLYADKAAYENSNRMASDAVCFGRSLSVLLEEGMFLKIVQGQAQVELLPTAEYAP